MAQSRVAPGGQATIAAAPLHCPMYRGRSIDEVSPWELARTFLSIFVAFSLLLLGIAAAR